MNELVDRLRHIVNWHDLDVEDRFWALKKSDLLSKVGLDEYSFDGAVAFADDLDMNIDNNFLTDPDDLACPYYLYDDLLSLDGYELLDALEREYPNFRDSNGDFSVVSQMIEAYDSHLALREVAQASRPQSDLATPEEALAQRRNRGRRR